MAYSITLFLFLLLTYFEEVHFRKYLYSRHQFILAGSLPNFLAAVIFSFAYMAVLSPNEKKAIGAIAAIVMGLSLYEVVQIWMPHMVFDVNDIFASVLGGLFSYIVIRIISKTLTQK